jgi:hypothetical protein
MTYSLLRNDSTGEMSDSAFLTKVLAGKLSIRCRVSNRLMKPAFAAEEARDQ